MSLTKVMSKNLITLEIDDDLGKAKAIFDQHKIHHILVLNDKELAGIITDRDIYKHLSPTIGTKNETPRDSSMLQNVAKCGKMWQCANRHTPRQNDDKITCAEIGPPQNLKLRK